MTHEYTILTGGTVVRGGGAPDASAIAWAHDTVLLVGSDDDVRAISRGDSHFIELGGAYVVPLGATLETGGPADLTIMDADPRASVTPPRTLAVVRAGRVIEGSLDALSEDAEDLAAFRERLRPGLDSALSPQSSTHGGSNR